MLVFKYIKFDMLSCQNNKIIKEMMIKVNNNLRVILAEQKKTIADVHTATGLSKPTITNIYYDRANNPEIQTLLRIAKYLGVSLDELLGTAANAK